MTIKTKIQLAIDKKAQKIREQRIARNNMTAQSIIFDFITNSEDSIRMGCTDGYSHTLLQEAISLMIDRIKLLDLASRVEVIFTSDTNVIQGVKVNWSEVYQRAMSCDATLYVDVSDMLFL